MDTIRVLHVDDEPGFGDVVSEFLEREDDRIDVITEPSATEGLRRLAAEGERIDCIVSDYDMPGTDGLDFVSAVREDYPDLPFILYTGKGSEAVASEAMSKGVTDYLQKGSGTEQYELLANRVRNAVEQYRSTEAAKRTRQRLQTLAESTSDCVWMFDEGWEELLFISGYEDVWNRSTETIREDPRDFLEGVHPEDRDHVRGAMERMSAGESIDIEYRICRGEEQPGWVWVQGEPVVDEAGAVQSVVGFTQDITDRKRREQELERYERIVENLPVGVFRTTTDGEFVDANEQYLSLLGATSKRELADFTAQDFWADLDDRAALLRQLETEGVIENREVEITTLDGDSRWIETTLRITGGPENRFLDGIAQDVTARRDRRQRLEQAEILFENAHDSLFLIDVDEGFTVDRVNPAYEDATGLGNEELSGRTPREILGEEQGAALEQKYRECVEHLSTLEYEETLRIDGARTIWETRIAPVPIDGDVEKIVGATRNVTDRKEHERKLTLVETLFENAEECLFIVDVADGEFELRHANEYYKRTVGLPPEEPVAGQTPTELFGETGVEEILDRYRDCVETRESVTYTVTLPVAEGESVYRTILTPVQTGGDVTHIVGTARDITDRERRTEQLRALNNRSQLLMTADSRERIAEIGVAAASETLGLAASSIHLYDAERSSLVPVATTDALTDLIGEPPSFSGGDSIAWRAYERGEAQALTDIRDDPAVYNPETPIRSELYFPLGEHGILLAGSPGPDAFEEQDFTMGKILAGNISSALEQVAKSDRLRAREETLRKKNERLEQFTSIVSHDLRNPLKVASGRLELAREECDCEHLGAIDRAIDRMNDLIEDLLTLANEGEAAVDLEPVDLAAIVADCWANVETAAATFETDIDRTIDAEESRLKQVFENLIRNAIEHGREDVTVTIGATDDGFYVEDDGPGIPDAEREAVFDAGYSTSEGGNGLGLNIVEQIVEAHDWEIHVTEGREGGARFEITGVRFDR